MTERELAAALGVSKTTVHRLKVEGMPAGDLGAARAWIAQHPKQLRIGMAAPTSAGDAGGELARLFALAEQDFAAVESPLRAALRKVPLDVDFDIPPALVEHLIGGVRTVMSGGKRRRRRRLPAGEIEVMGQWWHLVAAGEIVARGGKLKFATRRAARWAVANLDLL